MADEPLDALFRRLDRRAMPDVAFADSLFEQLAVEAGFRAVGGRSRILGRWRAVPPATARQLSWVAVLAALIIALLGLVVLGRGGQGLPTTLPRPAEVPAPTLHLGSSLLSVGSRAPTWTGRLLDGRPFSTDQLRGRPAAILMWCTCIRGPELRFFVEAARARDDIAFVLVSMDFEGTTRAIVDQFASPPPVVLDPEMALLTAWKLEGFPALVLLRPDGTVADVQAVTFGEPKLASLLDGLVAGGPIPAPDVRTPGPTDASGQPVTSGILEIGTMAPELSGNRLGGGDLSTRDFLGRPTVVLFWFPPGAGSNPEETTPDVLLDAVEERPGLGLLLVLERENQPGDAEADLARRGSSAAVILDPTGELFDRWGLVYYQSEVLLDAAGRVQNFAGPEGLKARDLDAAAEPAPSGP